MNTILWCSDKRWQRCLERLGARLDHEAKRITFRWAFNHFLFSRDSDWMIGQQLLRTQ